MDSALDEPEDFMTKLQWARETLETHQELDECPRVLCPYCWRRDTYEEIQVCIKKHQIVMDAYKTNTDKNKSFYLASIQMFHTGVTQPEAGDEELVNTRLY